MSRHPFYTEEHEAFRAAVREFVERELRPHANDWDEAGEFPRELYEKAGAVGLLGAGFPERYGGLGTTTCSRGSSSTRKSRAAARAACRRASSARSTSRSRRS